MAKYSIITDAPVGHERDLLHFDRYVAPLVSIFTNEYAQTPFTVGIFGSWGSGKSTLLKMLNDQLEKEHPNRFVCVQFDPWVYRRETNMLVPLLHALQDTLEEDRLHRFGESARKIGNVLLRLGADALLKTFTADLASVDKLETLEDKYLKERGRVHSEMRKLRTTLQQEANAVAKGADGKGRIVFFVDNLDRCAPDEIIDLLESVKLFLDLEHVFVVLAVDREVIDRGIEVKYSQFRFARDRKSALGAEYMEKLVQLPLPLFPLQASQVRSFMETLAPSPAAVAQLDLLGNMVLPNPRKIKRILNILALTGVMMESNSALKSLQPDLVARLVVLQVQAPELYAEVAKQPDLLVALERVYAAMGDKKRIRVDQPGDFADFGERGEAIQALCKLHYRPEGYMAKLFKDATFSAIQAGLPVYLSMLGA
jgi:energy-coupling factor transporter ATP-binding protein EcfA2